MKSNDIIIDDEVQELRNRLACALAIAGKIEVDPANTEQLIIVQSLCELLQDE